MKRKSKIKLSKIKIGILIILLGIIGIAIYNNLGRNIEIQAINGEKISPAECRNLGGKWLSVKEKCKLPLKSIPKSSSASGQNSNSILPDCPKNKPQYGITSYVEGSELCLDENKAKYRYCPKSKEATKITNNHYICGMDVIQSLSQSPQSSPQSQAGNFNLSICPKNQPLYSINSTVENSKLCKKEDNSRWRYCPDFPIAEKVSNDHYICFSPSIPKNVESCGPNLYCPPGQPAIGSFICKEYNDNLIHCCPLGKNVVSGKCETIKTETENTPIPTQICGKYDYCRYTEIPGSYFCKNDKNPNGLYCCPSGDVIVNNACVELQGGYGAFCRKNSTMICQYDGRSLFSFTCSSCREGTTCQGNFWTGAYCKP
ncbi:MAG: hypothetical protein U0946_06370 [Patescibacteria group bacterium]|nr:hypothetical protein [Patescibacteria group bacterium]